MKHGYIRTAAMTPVIKVADCEYNTEKIIELAGASVYLTSRKQALYIFKFKR
jgi:hypothetical protein